MKLIHTQRRRFIISHILVVIVSAMVSAVMSGCTSDIDSPSPNETMVTLSLNISTTDVSRRSRADITPPDYTEGAATDYEKMNQLRIIIVDGSGNVEHNRFYDYDNYYYENVTHELKVTANDTKTIYLIANERAQRGDISLGGDGATNEVGIVDYKFDQIEVGKPLPEGFSDYKLRLPVTSEMINNIPMSAVYKMQIGSESKQSLNFLLNRCAVKYSFNFSNQSSAPVRISELKIDKTATTEWFFPRVKKADGNVIMHQLEYKIVDGNMALYESSTDKEAKWLTDNLGKEYYFTEYLYSNYSVPPENDINTPSSTSLYQTYSKKCNIKIEGSNDGTEAKSQSLPSFYLLESAWYGESETPSDNQVYTVTLNINGIEWQKQLENLPILARNTHVKVNVKLKFDEIQQTWEVEMEPYRAVTLKPGFGIDDKDPDDKDHEHVEEDDLPVNNPDPWKPQS